MRALIGFPLLAILVLFALSNRQPVTIGFWPTDLALVVPLSIAILASMAAALLFGAVLLWAGGLAHRRRAARAEARVRALELQIEALHANPALAAPAMLPPIDA